MKGAPTFKIVLTALFAALTCVATMFIRIPSPIGGYLNLGDGVVLLCAYLLGPVLGTAAAGFGSMLADLLAGYAAFAPGTLVIKALVALTACRAFRMLRGNAGARGRMIVSGAIGESVMVLGYLAYEALILGYGSAAVTQIPGNIAQAAAGIAISTLLTPVLLENRDIRELLERYK